ETDSYTLRLDPGQTAAAVVRPSDSSLQVRLQLRDPSAGLLRTATATGPRQAVVPPATPAAGRGGYQLDVTGLAGSGNYDVSFLLNGAVEEEGVLAGAANDSVAAAQDIDGSSVALAGGADRLAVSGRSEGGDDFYSWHLSAGQSATLAVA